MSQIENLPTELILQIVSILPSESSLAALALANRRLHEICNPRLYQYNVLYGDNSALEWAAENGQIATFQKALDAGASLPKREAEGPIVTRLGYDGPPYLQDIRPHPISLAAKGGHISIVRYMISLGVSITTKDREQLTPLALAARNGDVSLVKDLLYMGASPYSESFWGRRPIWQAAFQGHMEVVKLFLSDLGRDKNGPDEGGLTEESLIAAALGGHPPVVKFLLAIYGLQVNIFVDDDPGGSLLFLAARKGLSDVVSLLLSYGADPNLIAHQRRANTPLTEAVIQGHEDVVQLLVHGTANLHRTRALAFAVAQGNKRLAEVLLQNGAPPQFCTSEIPRAVWNDPEEWVQPLLFAAWSGNLELAELLWEYGVDVNVQCSEYPENTGTDAPFDRVLFWAIEKSHEKMVDLLLERGADPEIADSMGCPLLTYAMEGGNETIVRSLLDYGVDIHRTVDNHGRKKLSSRKRRNRY